MLPQGEVKYEIEMRAKVQQSRAMMLIAPILHSAEVASHSTFSSKRSGKQVR